MGMAEGLRHAVAVLAHDDMESLARLINSFDGDFAFYVHIDRNWRDFSESSLRKTLKHPDCVRLYSWSHVKWGSLGIIKTQLKLISHALSSASYDYIHLMSGHDAALAPCGEIKRHFAENNGKEFMEWHQLPYAGWEGGTFSRLTRIGLYDILDYNVASRRKVIEWFNALQRRLGFNRHIPGHYPRLYGGSNWMSLTGNCWRYILDNYKPSFFRRLRFTFAPDEVFFQTVVMNSSFAANVTGRNLRQICWSASGAVKTLTKYDWWTLCKSQALFARKVSSGISSDLLEWIDRSKSATEEPTGGGTSCRNIMRRLDGDMTAAVGHLTKSLQIRSSLEFRCGNGIYVRFLRDNGIKADGIDIYPDTPEITGRLFPSGFRCRAANIYEPMRQGGEVDLALVLTPWIRPDAGENEAFIVNLASASRKYILILGSTFSPEKHGQDDASSSRQFTPEAVSALLGKRGFHRNPTAGLLLGRGEARGEAGGDRWLLYERADRNSI